jgi:hypothetical protein
MHKSQYLASEHHMIIQLQLSPDVQHVCTVHLTMFFIVIINGTAMKGATTFHGRMYLEN